MVQRHFAHDLAEESQVWVQEGLIDPGQRAAILQRYPDVAVDARDRTILILSILGSLLLAAGVVLFLAANWPGLPAWVKAATLLSAVAGVYAVGYYLALVRGSYPRVGHSLIFLGTLLYGAAIWLIAQAFHLESHYPNGMLLWAAGVTPMAWAVSSRAVLSLAALLFGVWTVMEQAGFGSPNWLYPLIAVAALLPLARRLRTGFAEAAVLVGLLVWFGPNILNQPASVHDALSMAARAMMLYGATVMAAGLGRLGEERLYTGIGGAFALAGTYLLTFVREWHGDPGPAAMPSLLAGGPYTLVLTGLALAVTAVAAWRYWQQNEPRRGLILPGVLLPAVTAAAVHLLADIPRAVTANVLLLAFTVGVVLLGMQRQSRVLINLGLVAFAVHAFTRYIDLFFSAMSRSAFFMVGGLLLLGGGWLLERNRRRWTQHLGGGSHAG